MAGSVSQNIIYVQGQAITGRLEAPIAPVATTIISSTSGIYGTDSYGATMSFPSPIVETLGGRVDFTSTQDLSAYQYFGCQLSQNGFPFNPASGGQAPAGLIDTLANGGMSILIFDALGNWSEFYFYGNEFVSGQIEDGGWAQFRSPGGAGALQLTIEKSRTPENSSGTLDWSQIDGYEYFIRSIVAYGGRPSIGVGSLIVFDPPELTGGTILSPATFNDFTEFFQTDNSGYNFREVFRNSGGIFNGGVGELFEPRFTYRIGDGVTQTIFRDAGSTLAEYPRAEDSNATQGCLFLDGINRGLEVNTSASCDIQLDNTVLSATDISGGESFVDVDGNTAANVVFNSCQLYRKTFVNQRHATISNSIFDTCYQIEIDTGSTLTDSFIRNSPASSNGLYIQDSAGTYTTSIDFRASNIGFDITIDPPIPGTYDFPSISVEAGHTISLRNDSATEALTIGIPTGIPFTTSTAGGTITVSTPPITITFAAPNLINETRVRLYNVTQSAEIENVVVSGGSGYSIILTLGTDYNSSDEVTLLATYQIAGVAKRVFRASAVLTTGDFTTVDSQIDWDNAGPNTLAIDGSTVSECTTDYIEIQVEVNDADNTTQKARIAAFIVDAITTEQGIRNWVALDGTPVILYSTNAAARIDAAVATVEVINVKAASLLEVKDSFEFDWSDGIDRVGAILGSSINWLAPARVLLQAIGSGVTAQDKTDIAALINPNIFDMQGTGFDTNNDSLVEIRDNQGGGGGGDATEANQITMLNNQAAILGDTSNLLVLSDVTYNELLTKSSQFSVDSLQASVDLKPSAIENADGLLLRSNQGGKDTGISVSESLMAIGRNKWDLNPTTGLMQVYEDDESTIAFSIQTGLAPRDPVNSGDPV